MRVGTTAIVLTLACVQMTALACDPDQSQNGCKIFGGTMCSCGYGCKTEYIFRNRRECHNAIRSRNSNICSRFPCVRGNCIQTSQDPGFICKCEGTGFYGQHCEKACPTIPMRGMTFPHECIVI